MKTKITLQFKLPELMASFLHLQEPAMIETFLDGDSLVVQFYDHDPDEEDCDEECDCCPYAAGGKV